MTVVINGTTGITNDGGYTGDGIVFADTTPANTLVTTTGGNVGIGTSSPSTKLQVNGQTRISDGTTNIDIVCASTVGYMGTQTNAPLVLRTNDIERARIDTSGNVGIGTSSPTSFGAGTTVLQTNASSSYAANLVSSGTYTLQMLASSANGAASIGTRSNHSLGLTTNDTVRATIDTSGNLLVGTTSKDGLGISVDPETSVGAPYMTFNKSYNGNINGVNFKYNSTYVGGITYSNTAVAYNTTSDYRLKENIVPMTGALEKVAQLKPVTYTWKADGSDGQGFIAHELQAVVPDCVTGSKDAVDVDGNPVYQGIDTSFLVATLTAAIQEQQALITQLQADVAALKANT